MSPIYPITRLAALIMAVDNDADQEELDILTNLPKRMAAHIESRSGVSMKFTISIGRSSRTSKSYSEMNDESEHVISKEEIAEIANETIQEYNDIENDDELNKWIKGIADSIEGEDLRFQSLKLFADMTAADNVISDEELDILQDIAVYWDLKEDLADFLFMKTKEEWIWKKGKILRE